MDNFTKLECCFVLVFCTLISSCWGEATEDNRQLYIVYMGAKSNGHQSPHEHSDKLQENNMDMLHEHSDRLQENHMEMLQNVLGESFASNALVASYKRSFNGFAAYLTEQEKQKLAESEGVVSIFPSQTLWPQTTRSWDFVGLYENLVNQHSNTGSDVVVGVLDSGIWPESESFSDRGFPRIPKKWKGACHGGRKFSCNKKLIGARYYTTDASGARDTQGHGTHTASTAAGNPIKNASFYNIAQGTARGGLPSARIAAYKVCHSGCAEADILSAFDDAIADGVDIITISIGSYSARDMRYDSIAIGALHAMQKGILTVHSAGNYGFGPRTVSSAAPWILTVAASSTDRGITARISLGSGQKINGKAVNAYKMNNTEFSLVYGKNASNTCGETSAKLCNPGCITKSLVAGKIVLCEDLRGIEEALDAGASGAITKSGKTPDISVVVPFPASVSNDLKLVQDYITSTKDAKAFISTSESVKNIDAPLVASFSGKGPNPIVKDLLKPDITAPGVDILAAFSPAASVSGYTSDHRSASYNIMSGTSMSAPHAAGAAAYVKSMHPDWSPSAIKSALMTTAWPMNPATHKDAEFSYGAGLINPVNATNPGLVYETITEDYIKLLCRLNYSTDIVEKLFQDKSIDCSKVQEVEASDMNYPSMTKAVVEGQQVAVSFSRTVTNVGPANSIYTAKIETKSESVTVEPATLSFKQVNEKKSFVVTVKGDQLGSMISASLVWSDGVHVVRSPIVVYPVKSL